MSLESLGLSRPLLYVASAVLVFVGAPAFAQDASPSAEIVHIGPVAFDPAVLTTALPTIADIQPADGAVDPWDEKPQCASMFLKADWQLTPRQRACAWLHDGVFSTNAILGAVWSAGFSQQADLSSERGDGFVTRFGRKFGQSALKSTAIYLGALVSREDTRNNPPYLVMRADRQPRGFLRRAGRAIGRNIISTSCVNRCTSEKDIRRRVVLSKVAGSFASGFSAELMTADRPDSLNHALRGSASAYAATFSNALVEEFKPELSAFASRIFRALGGSR